MRIILDGQLVKVGDKPKTANRIPIANLTPPSDIQGSMEELNRDIVEDGRQVSSIDQRARLEYIESVNLGICDFLVAIGFFPSKVGELFRQKKRLSVSIQGKGRDELVEISKGAKEHNLQKGLMEKAKSVFRKDEK